MSATTIARAKPATTPPARDERTPGLWTWGERVGGGYWIGANVAETFAKLPALISRIGRRGESRANARMMAHAPELVERIRAISVASARNDTGAPDLIEAIDAAHEAADRAEGLK